ncbi:MAG: hypothetical protein RL236_2047 [Pseudomonadota bacterium]|jgi:hypothetical protein
MEFDDYYFHRLRINDENARAVKLENTADVLKADSQVTYFVEQDINNNQKKARMALDSTVRASLTVREYTDVASSDLPTMVNELRNQCANFNAESTLIAQAITLDAIFNDLATQAACVGWNTNTDKAEQLLRLALRAQNQAGKTLQVILQNQQNKLLNGAKPNDSVDTSKTVEAIEGNKTVATLVKFDGRKNKRREKIGIPECV